MGSKLDTVSHRFQSAGRGQMYSMHCRCPGATDPRSLPPKHGTTTMQSCNALLPAEVPSPITWSPQCPGSHGFRATCPFGYPNLQRDESCHGPLPPGSDRDSWVAEALVAHEGQAVSYLPHGTVGHGTVQLLHGSAAPRQAAALRDYPLLAMASSNTTHLATTQLRGNAAHYFTPGAPALHICP